MYFAHRYLPSLIRAAGLTLMSTLLTAHAHAHASPVPGPWPWRATAPGIPLQKRATGGVSPPRPPTYLLPHVPKPKLVLQFEPQLANVYLPYRYRTDANRTVTTAIFLHGRQLHGDLPLRGIHPRRVSRAGVPLRVYRLEYWA